MNQNDINRTFTEKVTELLGRGSRSIISRPDKPHESCDTYP